MNDKRKIQTHKITRDAITYLIIAFFIWGIASMLSLSKGFLIGEVVYSTFVNIIEIIIAVFVIIGLIQVWISPQKLSKILGKEAGWKGLAFASTIPLFIGGSLFTIFPLMKMLREKGASNAVVLAFVSAWCGKVPLLPLEVEFLGVRFAILRILLIIPFAIAIGIVGELILERWRAVKYDGGG